MFGCLWARKKLPTQERGVESNSKLSNQIICCTTVSRGHLLQSFKELSCTRLCNGPQVDFKVVFCHALEERERRKGGREGGEEGKEGNMKREITSTNQVLYSSNINYT